MAKHDPLLESLATYLEEGKDLTSWIRENNISADDLMPTLIQAAAIIRSFTRAPQPIQHVMLAAGVAIGQKMASIIWANGIMDFIRRENDKRMKQL